LLIYIEITIVSVLDSIR